MAVAGAMAIQEAEDVALSVEAALQLAVHAPAELKCKACLCVFINPVKLPCGHSVCGRCAEGAVHSALLAAPPSTRPALTAIAPVEVACPTCAALVRIGHDGADPHFEPNPELRDAVLRFVTGGALKCPCGAPAVLHCGTCQGWNLCARCHSLPWQQLHVTTIPQEHGHARCAEHAGQPMELVCDSCDVLICLHCHMTKHKGHDVALLGERAKQSHAQLPDLAQGLDVRAGELQPALTAVDSRIVAVEKLHEAFESDLTTAHEKLTATLDKRVAELRAAERAAKDNLLYRLKAQRWVLSRVPAQLKRWAAALRGLGANTTAAPLFVWSALRHARRCRERAGTTDAAFAPLEVAQLRSTVAEATTPLLDALARFGDVGIQAPPSAMAPPTLARATASELVVAVRPPQDDGGAAVIKYELFATEQVEEEKAGEARAVAGSTTAEPSSMRLVAAALSPELAASGLTRGIPYALRVRAVNAQGTGPFSPPVTLRINPGREFKYNSHFDTHGLLYWLGTDGGRTGWCNPMDAGRVVVSASSQSGGTPHMVVGRGAEKCITNNVPNSWFAVDLGGAANAIRPTQYTLRHGYSAGLVLRQWVLEGSNDRSTWTVVRGHVNDESLRVQDGSTASWPLECTHSFCHFRVRLTGKNSSGNDQLAISGFEIYGATTLL